MGEAWFSSSGTQVALHTEVVLNQQFRRLDPYSWVHFVVVY